MNFRYLPNSMTLNDLERRNSLNRRVISQNSVDLGRITYKSFEDTPTLHAAEM